MQDTGTDVVVGRGLAIVQALTSLFWVSDAAEIRILLATIPSPAGGGMADMVRHWPGSPARAGTGCFGIPCTSTGQCAALDELTFLAAIEPAGDAVMT